MSAERAASHLVWATEAHHKLGDISRASGDLAVIEDSDEENYFGHWLTGLPFVKVRFPKDAAWPLSSEETEWLSTHCPRALSLRALDAWSRGELARVVNAAARTANPSHKALELIARAKGQLARRAADYVEHLTECARCENTAARLTEAMEDNE